MDNRRDSEVHTHSTGHIPIANFSHFSSLLFFYPFECIQVVLGVIQIESQGL